MPTTAKALPSPSDLCENADMQHSAYLSRPKVETGASLVIVGNRLATGDTLLVEASDKQQLTIPVAAFGLARLVVESADGRYECTPWKSTDEPLAADPGAASRWTVGRLVFASA